MGKFQNCKRTRLRVFRDYIFTPFLRLGLIWMLMSFWLVALVIVLVEQSIPVSMLKIWFLWKTILEILHGF